MNSSWNYWINEPVFLDDGVYNILKRKQAIYIFVHEGLVPMVESKGYKFYMNDALLTKTILQMVFALRENKKIQPLPCEFQIPQEFYDHFEHQFDSSVWLSFWNEWGNLQDFKEGGCGESLRYQLPVFVWSWIDFHNSDTIYKLAKELEEEEYQEEGSKGKDDPYLQETSKRDYMDRHW
jgi:hypothetical protein